MELISELLDTLSDIIREWDAFIFPDSDVGYFSDLDDFLCNSLKSYYCTYATRSLRGIKETFDRLQNYRQKLRSLRESLSRDFTTVR
jgi:hypothetical protein